MADFRRWVTVLAMLALFSGLASAQLISGGTSSSFTCNAVAQVTPTLRAEGLTELVGDIVLTCTGGPAITPGTAIPTVNITVGLTQPVTSRSMGSSGRSEALLLIDEPNSGLPAAIPGFGPAAPLQRCKSPINPLIGDSPNPACTEYSTLVNGLDPTIFPGGTALVATNANNGAAPIAYTAAAPGYNIFQGIVTNNNQVTFLGVPILPPVTSGIQRVYRITNIRVNATNAAASIVTGLSQIQAVIASSNPSVFPIGNPTVTVGYVGPSLTTTMTKINNTFTLCNTSLSDITKTTPQKANVAVLQYKEGFPSAFKTRVGPGTAGTSTSPLGYASTTTQNVPGKLYNSESGFVLNDLTYTPIGGTLTYTAGLADSGTRFQAVFSNLPTGATIWVSTRNLTYSSTGGTFGIVSPAPATDGDTTITSAALLTVGAASAFDNATATTSAKSVLLDSATPPTTASVVPLSVDATTGTATAVWEVVNTNVAQTETFNFGVFISYTAKPEQDLPTPGDTAAVVMSYAPLGTQTSPNWIPRFINLDTTPKAPLVTIIRCQTILLFPYVTSEGGFDTGIAISNTTPDPMGTTTTKGTCKVTFYGNANTPAATTTGVIGPFDATNNVLPTRAFSVSSLATGYTGYAFAVCDFQFAHGFAFVSDLGARNLAMGYLALIVNNGDTSVVRKTTTPGESLNN